MNILANTSQDKKAIVKATTTKQFLKDFVGEKLTLTNIFKYEKENVATGEILTNVVIETNEGWLFSQSPSVIDTLDVLLEGYETSEINSGVEIQVQQGTSNNKRTFFYIDIL